MGQNKRKQRTADLQRNIFNEMVADDIQNTIAQKEFDKMVIEGILVRER